MSLKLYFHPLSNFSQKAVIALYENDTPFEPCIVSEAPHGERLKELWPLAKFPVLHDDTRNEVIPESSIIIEYLAQHYPGKTALVPADADQAREVRLRDRFYDQYMNLIVQRIVGDRLRPSDKRDPFGVEQNKALLKAALGMTETAMQTSFWAVGDQFTMADCAAAPGLYYANLILPFTATHKYVTSYYERLMARPSFARAVKDAAPYRHLFPQ